MDDQTRDYRAIMGVESSEFRLGVRYPSSFGQEPGLEQDFVWA